MDLFTCVLVSSLLAVGIARKYQSNPPQPKKELVTGPFLELKPIVLTHAHPDGWGSGAVMQHIRKGPDAQAVAQIVRDLQRQGVAVVDNLYEDLCVEKLGYETSDVIREGIEGNHESKLKTITAVPHQFIESVIDSISNTFLKEMNLAYTEFHNSSLDKDEPRTVYWHPHMTFCEFSGFAAKQLRLRLPGEGLGLHVDRASAKLTALYYFNEAKSDDGDLVVYLLPEDKRGPEFRHLLAEGGMTHVTQFSRVRIAPKMNRFVVFWSDSVPHEVSTILSNRLSFQVFFSTTAPEESNGAKEVAPESTTTASSTAI